MSLSREEETEDSESELSQDNVIIPGIFFSIGG